MSTLTIKSPAFEANKKIPKKYTCEADGINPPLTIDGVPSQTKSLALILEDPDATIGTFDHWVTWNIPASTRKIEENSSPGVNGLNSGRKSGYYPPCPPSGTHRYIFKVFALDQTLSLDGKSKKADLQKAMQGHVLAEGELIGLYR
jgi:Raf kinase inhibitor-like YbhB/YbcL family protein